MKYNYHINDFTFNHYLELLVEAKENWRFRLFTDFNEDERFILWRHDVDFSIHQALKLAHIEHELGIKSTFFVLPHSDFYNILEFDITEIILEIQGLGHQIGLHFDSHYFKVKDEKSLVSALAKEKRFFKDILNIEIQVFSFHNTTEFTMGCKKLEYAGLINVYAAYFQDNVRYCSDSNGYWRFDRLYDVLKDNSIERLQILTHPVWWQNKPMMPFNRIQLAADQRRDSCLKNYEVTLNKYNRVNVK